MSKKIILTIALAFVISTTFGQKKLTVKNAVYDVYTALAPEKLKLIQWQANTNNYTYFNKKLEIVAGNYKSEKIKTITSVSDVTKALNKKNLGNMLYYYNIKWINENKFYGTSDSGIFIFDIKSKKITSFFKLPQKAENIEYNYKADAVAFTVENNLKLLTNKGETINISNENNKEIVFGRSVHRQEFNISKGIFWSPQAKYIAFYRKDETMVADYPLIDYTTFPATVKNIKYPMTGQTSEQVTLGIYNINKKTITYLKTGTPADQYLTAVSWDPTEKFIYVGILNRDQNHLKFNKYTTENGNFVKTLFEEKNKKYVEPQNPAIFLPKSKDKFMWHNQRDGYNHLYMYNTDGKFLKQITKGIWNVINFYGISQDEQYIYINSTAVCPIQRHIYKISLKNGAMDLLTAENGTHEAIFSADMQFFIDKYSNTTTPNVIQIRNNNGKIITKLLESKNPLTEYNLGKMKMGTLKSVDKKTNLYYQMFLPPDFDSTKKYPTIIYVYGGPHAQLVKDKWLSGGLWNYYMAQEGYIIFTIDNRGSANRGFDFESSVFRKLGTEEMKDQLKGIEFLLSKKYVDADRIGVHGWSFGGFMTISLMINHPEIFKVGVAGGPVIDWKYYEVMYGERYMDTPQKNPQGYKNASILNKVHNLNGKLLVIHGSIDPVVVPQNSMELLLKSQELDLQIDFYTYPNAEHNVRGIDRVHLKQKIANYFFDYL